MQFENPYKQFNSANLEMFKNSQNLGEFTFLPRMSATAPVAGAIATPGCVDTEMHLLQNHNG